MGAKAGFAFAAVALLACAPAAAFAADAGAPAAVSVTVTSVSGNPSVLTPAAQLPAIQVDVSVGTEHGPRHASFEGPLLWTVLDHAHVIPDKPRDQVRQTVLLTGQDGYMAALALGEISPEFEAKQVILAVGRTAASIPQPPKPRDSPLQAR